MTSLPYRGWDGKRKSLSENRELKKIQDMDKNPEHKFITRSVSGTLVNAIGKTVYKEEIDYIIMGTKGSSGLKEVFMGSNTYKVIKEIDF